MNIFTVSMDCPNCYRRNRPYLKTMVRKNTYDPFFCSGCGSKLTEVQINEIWKEIKK